MNQIIPKQQKDETFEKSTYNLSIPIYLILTIITCGLFNLYWNYKQMEACNFLLDRQEFKFSHWIIFSLLTCGIYHFFYQYKMGSAIVEIQKTADITIFDSLPILSCIVSIIGLSIVVDCIHQYEINKIIN